MSDPVDDLIEALVRAREEGMTRAAAAALVHDVYLAPWSHDYRRRTLTATAGRKRPTCHDHDAAAAS